MLITFKIIFHKLNMYEDVDSSNNDSLDLFSDIPNEKIIDYLKDNM